MRKVDEVRQSVDPDGSLTLESLDSMIRETEERLSAHESCLKLAEAFDLRDSGLSTKPSYSIDGDFPTLEYGELPDLPFDISGRVPSLSYPEVSDLCSIGDEMHDFGQLSTQHGMVSQSFVFEAPPLSFSDLFAF
jgi:hypothetical protein